MIYDYESSYIPHCGICKDSGWMEFRASQNPRTGQVYLDDESKFKAVIPCKCTCGSKRLGNYNRQLQEDVFEWIREKRKEKEGPQVPDDLPF